MLMTLARCCTMLCTFRDLFIGPLDVQEVSSLVADRFGLDAQLSSVMLNLTNSYIGVIEGLLKK